MFTGIVEELGRLRERRADGDTTRLIFDASVVISDAVIGASISVNGCCLTVVDVDDRGWAADAVAETMSRTNLVSMAAGDPVNLERAVRLSDRLGGHLVQGHVDGLGTVLSPAPDLVVVVPTGLVRYLVPKGSVTVDGISLTVVDVGVDRFSVAVIPHTGRRRPGDAVNLEVDVLAKYTERLLGGGVSTPYASLGESR